MDFYGHQFPTVRVFLHFKHPSGQPGKWLRGMYDIDEQGFKKLEEAIEASRQGKSKDDYHVLRLKTGHKVTINLSEISEVIRQSTILTSTRA